MNPQEAIRILDSIARDRGVDRDLLIHDLEQAMVSAAKKHFNTLDAEEFTCTLDKITGELTLYRHGEPVSMSPEEFGRIAAQTFKQVMIQKFREDERNTIYEEFSKRVGELATAVAQRYERGSLVCMIDRAESFMPPSEQIPGEQFHPGDRIRCLIEDVRDAGGQVKIVLSRASPDFIKRLFEVEVPEVAERVIEVKGMAREAGFRTKLAVSSIDAKVDAVGACVGVRGSRIKNIVEELSGEKIDIVRWNESSQILIQNALKPAEVEEVSLCFELGRATVVVRDDQLSLAIGKRGQNVRLAARLTRWDIDILTPEEFNKALEIMFQTLKDIDGVSEEHLDRLAALGMISVHDIEEVGAEVLVSELEIEQPIAEAMVTTASARVKVLEEEQAREKEEAAKQAAMGLDDLLGGGAVAEGAGDGATDAPAESSDAEASPTEAPTDEVAPANEPAPADTETEPEAGAEAADNDNDNDNEEDSERQVPAGAGEESSEETSA